MLVITRKKEESILIGEHIKITILSIEGNRVKVGFKAPKDTVILREELIKAVKEQNQLSGTISQTEIDFTVFKDFK